MKMFVTKLLLFIALFFASDFLLGMLVSDYHLKTENINFKNANYGFLNKVNDDILFFGASEVSHSFVSNRVTNQTGLSSYNLASDGCGIYYQYPLLETILNKYTPKVIVISAYQLTQQDSDYITRMYPYYDDNKYVKEIVDNLHPTEFAKLEFQGYVYNSQIIRIFDDRNNNENGYVPLSPRNNAENALNPSNLPQGIKYPIAAETKTFFTKFIKRAAESGSTIYVYIPPILEKIDKEYLDTITSITKNAGGKLIDFSNDGALLNRRDLFNDRIHLNHEGAKILTDKFIQILKNDTIY